MPSYFRKLILFLSIIVAIFTINNRSDAMRFLPLLPLVFGITYYFLIPKNLVVGAGMAMLHFVSIFRYLIYPLMLVFSNFEMRSSGVIVGDAIFLMLIEILVIFLTIHLYYRRIKIKGINQFQLPKTSYFVVFLSAIIMFVLFVIDKGVVANLNFILNSGSINNELIETSGITVSLFNWAKYFLISSVACFAILKYNIHHQRKYIYLGSTIYLIPCFWYVGWSRLSLMMPIIAAIFMIIKSFGKNNVKHIISGICLLWGSIMIMLSLQKFFDASDITQVDSLFDAHLLNAYFGGIDNIVCGIQAYQQYGHSLYYLFVDTFRNAMGISHFFANVPSTLHFFNNVVYAGVAAEVTDQIVPTMCQGLMYFGPILCFIPTIIMVEAVCISDRVWANTQNVYIAYVLATFATMVGWAIPGSYMHLTTKVFNLLLPMLFFIYLLRKYTFRNEHKIANF